MRTILLILTLAMVTIGSPVVASDSWQDLILQADILDTNGWFDSATVIGNLALKSAETENGIDDSSVMVVLMRLADYYGNTDKHEQTIRHMERALAISLTIKDINERSVAEILSQLGNANFWMSNYKDALSYYQRADKILVQLGDKVTLKRADILRSMGSTYCSLDKHKDASKAYKACLAMQEQLLPIQHPGRLNTHLNIASCCAADNDRDCVSEAEVFVMAQPFTEITNATEDEALEYMSLGDMCIKRGHNEKAEEAYLRALKIREAVQPARHRHTGETLRKLADLYAHTGRKAEADALYTRAITMMDGLVPPDYSELVAARLALEQLHSDK
jgi:tetratricopeptide (TPR) repeat protein